MPAPEHLSERAKKLWASVSRKRSAGRKAMLQTALECLDRADQAREAIESEGMTTTTKTTGAVHVHPLVKVERENRQLFAKLWRENGWHFDSQVDGRNAY